MEFSTLGHYGVHSRALVALVVGAMAWGLSQVPAAAATMPADGVAAKSAVRPLIGKATSVDAGSREGSRHAAVGNPLWAISIDSLTATRERPLFSPSRRPPPPVVVAAPAAPPPPPQQAAVPDLPSLTLVGTAVGEGLSIGVFVDQATKDVVRLKTGEGHLGWTLQAIRGREAVFAKEHRQTILALAPPSGTNATAATGSVPAAQQRQARLDDSRQPARAGQAASPRAEPPPKVAPPGKWLNGDGEPIDPPPRTASPDQGGTPRVAAWVDGDGQPISPPPAPPGKDENGKPLGPPVWLDGYGRPIGPAPTAWVDGDGETIAPPPYHWLDSKGQPITPPPAVWVDGDGQLIGPPLTQISHKAEH